MAFPNEPVPPVINKILFLKILLGIHKILYFSLFKVISYNSSTPILENKQAACHQVEKQHLVIVSP
jgi:hypothetical protein